VGAGKGITSVKELADQRVLKRRVPKDVSLTCSSVQPVTRRNDGLCSPRPPQCTRRGLRPRGGPRLCCRYISCTDNDLLEVQVHPSPGKQAAVLRALRNSDLLQQAVCASRLGDTQTHVRDPSALADLVARGGQAKDFNRSSDDLRSRFQKVPGLFNEIELMVWTQWSHAPIICALASDTDINGSTIRVQVISK